MHYRNGREAKNGDKIVKLNSSSGEVVAFGVLHSATPGNDWCNGNIAVVQSATEGTRVCAPRANQGCGCTVVGGTDAHGPLAVGSFISLLALVVARSRRRA